MQLREVITSSKDALKGNPLRTGLTMLGIIIGISSVILISSIGQGALAFVTNQLSVFGTNFFRIAPGKSVFETLASTSDPVTTEDADAIRNANIANVEQVVPVALSNRDISTDTKKEATRVYGMSPQAQIVLKPEIVYGEFMTDANLNGAEKVAVLGVNIAEDFFGEGTDPVGEYIRVDNSRYRVIGVSRSIGGISDFFNNGINIPVTTLINDISGEDKLFEIIISVKDDRLLNQTITDVEDFLRDYRRIDEGEDSDFFAQSFKDALGTIQTVTTLLTAMVTGISAISLLVGGIGVMNIMLVTVTERTREVGLLKAIGAKEQDILTQFLIEAIALSLAGGLVGIIIGIIGAFGVSRAANIPFVVSPATIIIAVGVSTLVGIVFGLYPARQASKLNPIDALRYE